MILRSFYCALHCLQEVLKEGRKNPILLTVNNLVHIQKVRGELEL